jgi:hypothetical protein
MCRKPKYYALGSARPWAPSRCLLGCVVALAVVCSGSTPSARAQVTISNGPSTNHVVGEGLSPSFFIPPSQLPVPTLEQGAYLGLDPGPTTVLPQPSALHPPNPAIPPNPASDSRQVGSGVPSNPQFPSVVGSSALPDGSVLPQAPAQPMRSVEPNNSIDLDLRSPGAKGAPSSFLNQSPQPLSSPSPWFFSTNALFLNLRQGPSRLYSSPVSDPELKGLASEDIRMPSTGGYELGVGRYIGCGKYALGASYWGLSPDASLARIDDTAFGPLATNLPFNVLSSSQPGKIEGLYLGVTPMSDSFRNASEHRLESQREFHNLDMNFYWFATGGSARQPFAPRCDESRSWTLSQQPTGPNAPWFHIPSRLRLSLYSGVRWFQIQDAIDYRANDAYIQSDVRNDLWGLQTGAISHWSMTPRWSLWSNVNAGVYNNRGTKRLLAGDQAGLATVVSPGASNGTSFDFDVSGNSTALLGETSTGLGWHIARGWTANVGYRVLGVSGIGTAEGQIPSDFRIPSQSSTIQTSESLILHGFTLGATYNF